MPSDLPPMKERIGTPLKMGNKVTCGIDKLDVILEGGFTRGSAVSFFCSHSVAKNLYPLQFANSGLKSNEGIIYVLADFSIDMMEQMARDHSLTRISRDSIYTIDCSSWAGGKGINPQSLEEISIQLNAGLSKRSRETNRVVIHSLSTILLYNDISHVFKFVGFINSKLKSTDTTIIYVIDKSLHSAQVINTIKHLSDYIIEIKEEDADSQLVLEVSSITMLPVVAEVLIGGTGLELA